MPVTIGQSQIFLTPHIYSVSLSGMTSKVPMESLQDLQPINLDFLATTWHWSCDDILSSPDRTPVCDKLRDGRTYEQKQGHSIYHAGIAARGKIKCKSKAIRANPKIKYNAL